MSRNVLTEPWYTVDQPWGDGTHIVAGSPDPHGGVFVADCEGLLDPADLDRAEDAAEIAEHIAKVHNNDRELRAVLGIGPDVNVVDYVRGLQDAVRQYAVAPGTEGHYTLYCGCLYDRVDRSKVARDALAGVSHDHR